MFGKDVSEEITVDLANLSVNRLANKAITVLILAVPL